MIPDFKTYIGESVWNDMRKRSLGNEIKAEDDINHFTMAEMFEYMHDHYPNLINGKNFESTIYSEDDEKEIDIDYFRPNQKWPEFRVIYSLKGKTKSIYFELYSTGWSIYHKLMDLIQPTKQFSTKTEVNTKNFKVFTRDKQEPDNKTFVKLLDCLNNYDKI